MALNYFYTFYNEHRNSVGNLPKLSARFLCIIYVLMQEISPVTMPRNLTSLHLARTYFKCRKYLHSYVYIHIAYVQKMLVCFCRENLQTNVAYRRIYFFAYFNFYLGDHCF